MNNDNGPANLLLARIKKILGPYYYQRPTVGVTQDKEAYLEALLEKYLK